MNIREGIDHKRVHVSLDKKKMAEKKHNIHSPFSPPVSLVDTTIAKSVENVQRVVDDTPLRERGFPPIP